MSRTWSADDTGIIILAAGKGERFGSDKRRAVMADGTTLLESTLARIPPELTRRILVLKPGDDELAGKFSASWQICFAADPQAGMANSLASGIRMANAWQAALIGLGDMPYIQPATYVKLQKALAQHPIVIPVFNGRRGNPVGFRRQYFADIMTLEGDQGARSLLQQYASDCFEQETADAGILRDVDEPDALAWP